MIYISSSCVKRSRISESVEILAENGFLNIELSGGTEYYHGITDDLLRLKKKYSLNYLLHNYFPPPSEHFTLNLASAHEDVVSNSFSLINTAVELSRL